MRSKIAAPLRCGGRAVILTRKFPKMTALNLVADKIDRAVQRVTPLAYRIQRRSRRWMRRALRKPRSVSEGPNLLPLLIQVLASFSKADGVLLEEEIDSSLGFLRYDYPEAVYSGAAAAFPPGALRAAGPFGDGAEALGAAQRGSQDHAGRPALRSDFTSGPQAGTGRRLLLVHVAARHGGAGHRYRLSVERFGGFGRFDLPARGLSSRSALFRNE